ncbi:hypothetical protein FFM54_24220 [Burkholderia pseudomallei]|nr:hypothetical protein FFM54_24220 [Burkholderia pseudomallei]
MIRIIRTARRQHKKNRMEKFNLTIQKILLPCPTPILFSKSNR